MELVSDKILFTPSSEVEIPLHKLPIGKAARVKTLLNKGLERRRLLDLGLIPDSIVRAERVSPSGNPIAYNIRGSVIALRREETSNVIVRILDA